MKRMRAGRAALAGVLATGLLSCSEAHAPIVAELNGPASLVGKLPVNPLLWKVITSSADTKNGTMATLYGNDAAAAYARSRMDAEYPVGAQVALVTWKQEDDARWFGARIPGAVEMVEFVTVNGGENGKAVAAYVKYAGTPLSAETVADAATADGRARAILGQRASVMP